jgi:CRP/FNR family transcriptional regulator, anaerobic regulatory protein
MPTQTKARGQGRPGADIDAQTGDRVSRTVFPAIADESIASDGDAVRFCSTCAFSQACMDEGMDKGSLRDLHVLVEHVGPLPSGTYLFREGDPFDAIAAVRSGTVKTSRVDREGREQILGFHFPGEIIGLSAIDGERYLCNALALDSVHVCRFSFPKIAALAARLPGLQKQLFRLLSRDIGHAERLSGDHSADERIAAFLIGISRRLAARGFSPDRFQLTMPRTDIANYLRLAPETVSRVLRRFQDDGTIRVRRREVELRDRTGLETLAEAMLRT